ncbi:MAG: terminase family protein [Pseudotabrizicola sp.]|uniref:DNA-packaging protein n=1 Tax=Pseudotabrizicola sp. TaxID=2939647 RepID=UPI002717F0E0|nr:terminase family protein [Pseudotabrizicola sp.]MDO9638811.1 terminase family protein [Pseudotabrizicola sp.]
MRSGGVWLSSATPEVIDDFLGGLSNDALLALPWMFEFWALPHQLPPEGAWKSWVIMGGRGAGKTRAGAEWVRAQVEGARPSDPGRASRVALVAETLDEAREVMVFGDSGIMACSPPDRRPEWNGSRRMLTWPNGATARLFSAYDPDSLRGPQFDAAWVDELAKWNKAEATWDQLQFALRLGPNPQQVVTTTPQNIPVLKAILKNPSTVMTHAPTDANRAYLAKSFLEEVQTRYGGKRLGRQELEGELIEDIDGALWTMAMLEAARGPAPERLSRVVVAVDPPVTSKSTSDECGIVVVGVLTEGNPRDWRAVVLEDASISGTPTEWARAAVAAYERHDADRMVAEINQGGDMVEQMIRQQGALVAYRGVSATKGKILRAEPVAALYEQGQVVHCGQLRKLEDQMCLMSSRGFKGEGSPDRVDALVWAMHEAMLAPAKAYGGDPRMRALERR